MKCGLRFIGTIFCAATILLISGIYFRGFAQNKNNSAGKTEPSPQTYAELAKAPESVRGRQNPLEGDSTAVAAGRKLYELRCASCHGNTAEGGKKAPSLRVAEVRTATPGMLFWLVTNGVVRRGMPVWSRLPEQQRWQIVSYLKSLD